MRQVIPSGKTFIRRIIDLLRLPAAATPFSHICLIRGFRSDIEWWCQFLPSWNGLSFLPPTHYAPHAVITSDASGKWDVGHIHLMVGSSLAGHFPGQLWI